MNQVKRSELRITTYVTPEVKTRLMEIAIKDKRTVSALVAKVLDEYLESEHN